MRTGGFFDTSAAPRLHDSTPLASKAAETNHDYGYSDGKLATLKWSGRDRADFVGL